MSYSAEPHRSTGDFITAAIWNQAASDNPAAIYAGAQSLSGQAQYDVMYASTTTQWVRLALGSLGQSLGVTAGPAFGYINSGRSKVSTFTHTNSAADANQAVTGVGFLPAAVAIWGGESTPLGATVGIMTASQKSCIYWDFTNMKWDTGHVISVFETAGNTARATPVSLDSDGFTIAWVKGGSPSGLSQLTYFAIG